MKPYGVVRCESDEANRAIRERTTNNRRKHRIVGNKHARNLSKAVIREHNNLSSEE